MSGPSAQRGPGARWGRWAGLLVGAPALVAAGCLPSSGRRTDRSVSPADSASVALAETVPTDTLALVWTAAAPEPDPMELPTTVAWADGRVAVVDTKAARLRFFSAAGRPLGARATGGGAESFPYLAGVRGDSVVVLERGAGRLAFVPAGPGAVRRVPAPAGATAALATDSALFVRTGGGPEGGPAALARLDERGRVVATHPLRGQPWRANGFLRAWRGGVAALSGYRPVVDVLAPGAPAGGRADTLALGGFSSPQLARSAQFMRGDADQPPLLTSSAAPLGDRLFVLNMRVDHVRVDVYDRAGRLERVLVSPGPWSTLAYVPVDVAARRAGARTELAVLLQRASGLVQTADSRVVLYRWAGPPGSGPPSPR